MSTSNAMASALATTLKAGTALVASLGEARIYRTRAPDSGTLPYVVFSAYAGGPMNEVKSDLREVVYFVRAYGWDLAQVGTIDAQVSALLHGGSITVPGYSCVKCWREEDLELVEDQPTGAPIYMAGGLYRVTIDD